MVQKKEFPFTIDRFQSDSREWFLLLSFILITGSGRFWKSLILLWRFGFLDACSFGGEECAQQKLKRFPQVKYILLGHVVIGNFWLKGAASCQFFSPSRSQGIWTVGLTKTASWESLHSPKSSMAQNTLFRIMYGFRMVPRICKVYPAKLYPLQDFLKWVWLSFAGFKIWDYKINWNEIIWDNASPIISTCKNWPWSSKAQAITSP